jgi:hypothetical protein
MEIIAKKIVDGLQIKASATTELLATISITTGQ